MEVFVSSDIQPLDIQNWPNSLSLLFIFVQTNQILLRQIIQQSSALE